MESTIFVIGVVALVLVGIVLFMQQRREKKMVEILSEKTRQLSEEATKNILREERQGFEKYFDARERGIKTQLNANESGVRATQEAIKELVGEMRRQLNETVATQTQSDKQTLSQFQLVKTALDEYKSVTRDLAHSADGLKELLSNNKMRGRYGEEVAEDLLRSMGWIEGKQYDVNKTQDAYSTRPDFCIKLPDGSKINVDAKFPFAALLRHQEATTEADRDRAMKEFESDVKEQIKQCAGRDYINPEENTVDFVIMFVPNEMIFSLIYDRLRDVWDDGLKKKVILAGPFSFTAILRMVYQSYEVFKYQENLGEILKYIKKFETEWEKYSSKVDVLGKTLGTLTNHYEELSTTRTRQLQRTIDKISNEGAPLLEGKDD